MRSVGRSQKSGVMIKKTGDDDHRIHRCKEAYINSGLRLSEKKKKRRRKR